MKYDFVDKLAVQCFHFTDGNFVIGAMVYLIEDDEGSRHSLESLFAAHGISTRSFESAERFLDIHAGEAIAPEGCIVSDLVLPGISGLELLQHEQTDRK